MDANDTKGKNEKKGFTGFSCCSGNLAGMREMMNNFCGGADGVPDCSTMMKGMMKLKSHIAQKIGENSPAILENSTRIPAGSFP